MQAGFDVPADHLAWLEEFRRQHGRPPRVLHIGNIANNAYVYSKVLNRAGLWSDVVCYDYYHIMGCPEWEESDYRGDIRSDFYPAWEQVDLRGYQRPLWFAQGPTAACLQYLTARCDGQPYAQRWWEILTGQRVSACAALRGEELSRAAGTQARGAAAGFRQRFPLLRRLLGPAYDPVRVAAWRGINGCRTAARGAWRLARLAAGRHAPEGPVPDARFRDRVRELCGAYAELFPERTEPLRPADFKSYGPVYPLWAELIRRYDVVIGYATDGVYPLLVHGPPYLALEHGTIRNIPFQDTPQGKLCALTYRQASRSLITNCDNMHAAEKLRLEDFRFLPHPINEDLAPTVLPGQLRAQIQQKLDCDFVLFHPSRHHWTAERHPDWEKGNDVLIEGFAAFMRQACPKAGAVFVEWGQKVGESKALLQRLGLGERVLWVPPQPIPRMLDYIRASDVLADQFYLGAFGSITPKAWMLGCPTLLYLHEEQHRRCFPILPPLINARTAEQVCAGLTRLYRDRDYAQSLRQDGAEWYRRYHSNQVILANLLDGFRGVLVPGGAKASAGPALALGA